MLQLGREVLDLAARTVGVGVSADEVDRVVHEVRAMLGTGRLEVGLVSMLSSSGMSRERLLSISTQLLQLPKVLLHVSRSN